MCPAGRACFCLGCLDGRWGCLTWRVTGGDAAAVLAPIIRDNEEPKFLLRKDEGDSCFTSLAKGILYQQISITAGSAIVRRLKDACGGAEMVTPEVVLSLDEECMRTIGVSGRKASYLKALATEFATGTLTDEGLRSMPDEELREALTKIKGVGPWTVDMFSMFYLGRPDILPVGDLAVRKGLKVLYNLPELPGVPEMESITEQWRPFRSVGSSYMWKVESEKAPRSPGKSKATKQNGKSPVSRKSKVPVM
ncbi:unnamed protein product [Ostreobium quekettii]|uniref:HhH-GPD domain-containing protein n=1 Tax=Ostreobium quekettii TaxID=121088 RepID=A0A8S1IQN6_9CHLO|nr:unnamed protein product [Ostreobium quekettii]